MAIVKTKPKEKAVGMGAPKAQAEAKPARTDTLEDPLKQQELGAQPSSESDQKVAKEAEAALLKDKEAKQVKEQEQAAEEETKAKDTSTQKKAREQKEAAAAEAAAAREERQAKEQDADAAPNVI